MRRSIHVIKRGCEDERLGRGGFVGVWNGAIGCTGAEQSCPTKVEAGPQMGGSRVVAE